MSYLDVPGWFTKQDGDSLKKLVNKVPPNGNILELGSLVGKSTCCIMEEIIGKNIRLHCVDNWKYTTKNNDNLKELVKFSNCSLDDILPTKDKFYKYTEIYQDNISAYNMNIEDFKYDLLFDLIFIDAFYTEEYLKDVFKYFFNKLAVNGILCGHDYSEEFPYKYNCINELAEELNQTIITGHDCSIWYFKKKE